MCVRKPIIEENSNEDFLIDMSSDGINKIRFIEVIGSGGSCLVYRGKLYEGLSEKAVIIKEYYPKEVNTKAHFRRDNTGSPLTIEGNPEDVEYELNLKYANIKRELETNNKLYATNDKKSNNPYMFATRELCSMPSEYRKYSGYIIIDTSEGMTLKKALELHPKGKYDLIDAIGIVKKMLIIIDYMSRKRCIHGDLSLENIYMTGNGVNEQMRFLDFGSAFFIDDYTVDKDNQEEVINMAEKIMRNLAICSSHDDIRSIQARELESCKQKYYNASSKRNALALINAIGNIDIKCDLYATVNDFYKLITGIPYNELPSIKELQGQISIDNGYIKDDIIVYMLHDIFKKNSYYQYDSVDALRKDFEEIEKIVKGMVTPKSLLRRLQMEEIDVDFDEKLLTDIEI